MVQNFHGVALVIPSSFPFDGLSWIIDLIIAFDSYLILVLKKVGCQECRSFDGLALNWPVESKAITIATYIKERWEETGHDKNNPEEYIVLR